MIEYSDAMCSWAWGTEPKLRLLRWRFEDQLERWRLVMGHLVEDEYFPVRDRQADAPKLESYWKVVCDQTGMPRPAPLLRSTGGSRASGLAVKAAQRQSTELAQLVMRRMREATFVSGLPADSAARALEACQGVSGLDHERLCASIDEAATADSYEEDRNLTRTPNEFVLQLEGDRPGIGRAREAKDGRMRFVFPTIVVQSGDRDWTVPGWMPYEDYEGALFAAGARPTERTRSNPTPAEAFARWPSLAAAEFDFLCGANAKLPAEVTTTHWDGGTIYRTAAEAAAVKAAALVGQTSGSDD